MEYSTYFKNHVLKTRLENHAWCDRVIFIAENVNDSKSLGAPGWLVRSAALDIRIVGSSSHWV